MGADTIDSDSNLRNERLPIKDHFLGWQCRVREHAMRNGDGRPSSGMRPRVLLEDGAEVASAATLLLVPIHPQESIQQFRFMALKTNDPRERLKKAIELLSSTFYQHVENFSGVMTGLFPGSSETVKTLVNKKSCVLEFDYQQQSFRIPFRVRMLQNKEPEYEFTYWHNYLFNLNLSPEVKVLHFKPDWSKTVSEPTPF